MRFIVTSSSNCGRETKEVSSYVTSSQKIEKIKMEEGSLYRYLLPERSERTIIGEAKNDSIYSALSSKRTYGLVAPIDISEVEVYIYSSDGKQTHKELVDEHMGYVYPIKGLSTHDKYKYIVDVEGTDVALSAENVVFIPKKKYATKEQDVIEVDGIIGTVHNMVGFYTCDMYLIREIFSGYKFYAFSSMCVDSGEFHELSMSSPCRNEVLKSDIQSFKSSKNSHVRGYQTEMGRFGYNFIVKGNGELITNVAKVLTKDLEGVKDLLKDRFLYDPVQKLFYLNPKYEKIVILERETQSGSESYRHGMSYNPTEAMFNVGRVRTGRVRTNRTPTPNPERTIRETINDEVDRERERIRRRYFATIADSE